MNPKLKRLIEETDELKRQITNLKSKIRRRAKKLVKTFDLLERGRIEAEIELLEKQVAILTLEEIKRSLPIIEMLSNFGEVKLCTNKFDWEKAGRA